jgi:hypothetical protein
MQYVIKDLIGQLIDTLKKDSVFQSVQVARHCGEVNIMMFNNPEYWGGLVKKIPFVLIKYNGRMGTPLNTTKTAFMHEVEFGAYVGTKSMKDKESAIEEAEVYLAKIFDLWHGKMFYGTKTWPTGISSLDGVQITTSGFNQHRMLIESGGQDERLIMALPEITLYETKYNARFLVS